ncbi:DUF2752 domain-containing protein [Candidatus Magnetomonas plexicatena]|uniref:DUF2752 domain-containing protein n=1 Tax=Candidatus Magnetomonas plexicatena TaxID=2552947 RepID=UPI0011030C0D|nr:DUF2752 domain-containing protein [Nitrospirales bacterium LBB_01]
MPYLREIKLYDIIITVSVISVLVFLYCFTPEKTLSWLKCPFLWFTGFYCPGCGSLRATHQLLHGHILNAIRYNHLLVLTAPFLVCAFASRMSVLLRGKPFFNIFIPSGWINALVIYIVLFWFLRNLHFYPLTLLAPK